MPLMLKKPPGQSPSFCVSTLRPYSARPPYSATSSRPPVMTPWGSCRRSRSTTTPFFPNSSRSPNQSPVSRGRSRKLPPHVGGISTGCVLAGLARTSKAKPTMATPAPRVPCLPTCMLMVPALVRPAPGSVENGLVALDIERPRDVLEGRHLAAVVDTDLALDQHLELGAHRQHEVLILPLLRREIRRLGRIRLEIEELDVVVPVQLVERAGAISILRTEVARELVPPVEDRPDRPALLEVRGAAAPQ